MKTVEEYIERHSYFQSLQLYPVSNNFEAESWLNNFSDPEDIDIAIRLLEFYMFISESLVEELLKWSTRKALHAIQEKCCMTLQEVLNKCYFSFIPGEIPKPCDSGHIFVRMLRDRLHICEDNILDFSKIECNLIAKDSPFILVDDFVGSGEQCIKAWNDANALGFSMSGYVATGNIVIYAPLLMTQYGYNRILENCPGLILCPTHIIDDEYNLFSDNCIFWHYNDIPKDNVYRFIISKSVQLKWYPNKEHVSYKGFHDLGLALSFHHGTPDATLPIFWACETNWNYLFQRSYDRG